MQYVAIDIETSSLERDPVNLLEAAFVFEDTDKQTPVEELPYLRVLFHRDVYAGDAYALALNSDVLKEISAYKGSLVSYKGSSAVGPSDIVDGVLHVDAERSEWDVLVYAHLLHMRAPGDLRRIVAAGKNVAGFDLQFFTPRLREMFHHRSLDPGSMFIDWNRSEPMSLDDLKKVFEVPGEVKHRALEDARDVVRVIRAVRQERLNR